MAKRSVYDKTVDLIQLEPSEVIRALVETPFWPRLLETNISYARQGDDTSSEISIAITRDADTWVSVFSDTDPDEISLSQRFRSGFGGGESERVRNALLVLALAIKLENEARPQDHRRKIDKAAKKPE